MKIGMDGTPLALSSGGLRRYTEELARALAMSYPADEVYLLSDQRLRIESELPPNVKANPGRPPVRWERFWWSAGLLLRLQRFGCRVFHGTDFAVPYLPLLPSVMTLHDLSPWLDPAWHGAGADRVRRRAPYLLRLGIATMVITPTEAVRRGALDYFNLPPDRVCCVPEAAAAWLRPQPRTGTDRYFLFVGTLEPRKNISVMLDAFRQVRSSHDVELWVVGRTRPGFQTPDAEPRVRLLGEAADEDLAGLYSNAIACVYPSLYEGFGLPVLEAMQCGTPVITSRDPALLEVSGGEAMHVDAKDSRALAAAMMAMLNPELRFAYAERALVHSAKFSWARSAKLTREVYDEAIERFRI